MDTLAVQEYFQPPIISFSFVRRELFICIRNDRPSGLPEDKFFGDGTEKNPYDGSTQPRLDFILQTFGQTAGLTIRLGPGVFQTKGGQGNSSDGGAWSIGSNVRILGSGMYQTTLQLVGVLQQFKAGIPKVTSTPIITSSAAVNDVEISDLTLDCNGHRQGVFQNGRIVQPKVMVNGMHIAGSNLLIRRVRVIHWGTFESDAKGGLECFPIFVGAANSSHPAGMGWSFKFEVLSGTDSNAFRGPKARHHGSLGQRPRYPTSLRIRRAESPTQLMRNNLVKEVGVFLIGFVFISLLIPAR